MPIVKTNDRQAGASNSGGSRTPGAGPAQRGLMGRLRGPAGASNGQTSQRSSTSRFLVGSVAFILIAEVLTYLIALANVQWKLGLNSLVVANGPSFLTWYFLINVVIIVGVWVTMQRLGFFPRDRFAPRNGTTMARGGSDKNGTQRNAAPTNQIPGIGKQRTRAARRHVTTAAIATASPNARRGAVESRTVVPASTASEHDEVYDRVKAAQRLRRRRDARR